jgi:Sulfotransferase family
MTAATGPIYIGGLDRCGKTTLAGFLTSHPHISVPAVGSNLWTYFYGQFGDLGRTANFERCLDALLHYKHAVFLQPDPARLRRDFAAGPPTYARLFELVHVQYAERAGKPRYGVQTGLIERYADELFHSYPDVRVIHMVRDPRDRYEASLALWPDGRGRAGAAAARWSYSMRLAARHAARYPDRYQIVRFEDLVREPETTLRQVCAFVGEPFVAEMLAMDGAPARRARLLEHPDATTGHLLAGRAIGGHRGRVPDDELTFLQLHLGRRMRTFGYEPEPVTRGVASWARFAVRSWPDQGARMLAWRTVEELQQRWPAVVRRTPDRRMVLAEPGGVP